MLELYEYFEIAMILCFGASWPFNVVKSYKTRTTKGKSLLFLILILVGYVFGILCKFLNEGYMAKIGTGIGWLPLASYFFNFTMVAIDFALYFRNLHYDKVKAAAEAVAANSDKVSQAVNGAGESVTEMAETIGEIEAAIDEIRSGMNEAVETAGNGNEQ